MRITRRQLRRLIREELEPLLPPERIKGGRKNYARYTTDNGERERRKERAEFVDAEDLNSGRTRYDRSGSIVFKGEASGEDVRVFWRYNEKGSLIIANVKILGGEFEAGYVLAYYMKIVDGVLDVDKVGHKVGKSLKNMLPHRVFGSGFDRMFMEKVESEFSEKDAKWLLKKLEEFVGFTWDQNNRGFEVQSPASKGGKPPPKGF